ncbi:MAG TPA: EF-hand domain-containing protein [Gemmataceae bacterium]|nr:EF-hand domain-containing protein [Gemmataceae bacterium]
MRSTTCFAIAVLALSAFADLASAQNANTKIQGNNAQYIPQLQAQFNKMDLDQDTFLDKDELAKAFHGPKAKAPTQGMYDDQGHLTKTYYDARTKYPELILLWAADKDGDERLSWNEYETYELKLLNAQQQQQQAMQRAYQSATRSTYTQSRRGYYNRNNSSYNGNRHRYSRNSSRSYSPGGYASYAQRSMLYQQQQMMIAAQNWQRMQMQAMINYQRMYQQMMLQRLQAQRIMAMNYLSQQHPNAVHRVVQRHQNPAVRRPVVRPARGR